VSNFSDKCSLLPGVGLVYSLLTYTRVYFRRGGGFFIPPRILWGYMVYAGEIIHWWDMLIKPVTPGGLELEHLVIYGTYLFYGKKRHSVAIESQKLANSSNFCSLILKAAWILLSKSVQSIMCTMF
jgi:hypothetical protein